MNVHENVHVAKGVGGWFASFWYALLVMVGSLVSLLLVIVVGGSLTIHWTGMTSRLLMVGAGLGIGLLPAFFLNGFLTWLRQTINKRARFFDTFFTVCLLGNIGLLTTLVLWLPGSTSHALGRYGNWLFDRDVAKLFQISEQHPVLRTGRKLVKRMAYLLEVDPSHSHAAIKRSPERRLADVGSSKAPKTHGLGPKETGTTLRDLPFRRPALAPPSTRRKKPTILKPGQEPPAPSSVRGEFSIQVRRHGNSLIVPLGLPRGQRDFLLDTGASFLSLSSRTARRLGVLPPRYAPTLSLHTANGVIQARVGRLPYLKLGPHSLRNVAFVLCDACGEPQQDVVGLLGLNVLRRFLVTIDQANGSIRLRPHDKKRFSNQAADLRPFVKWPKKHLKGFTTNLVVRRVFKLSGVVENHATLGANALKFRVTYLRNKRKVGHYSFSIDELEARGRLRVSIQDKRAPKFESYRVELVSGQWDKR